VVTVPAVVRIRPDVHAGPAAQVGDIGTGAVALLAHLVRPAGDAAPAAVVFVSLGVGAEFIPSLCRLELTRRIPGALGRPGGTDAAAPHTLPAGGARIPALPAVRRIGLRVHAVPAAEKPVAPAVAPPLADDIADPVDAVL